MQKIQAVEEGIQRKVSLPLIPDLSPEAAGLRFYVTFPDIL